MPVRLLSQLAHVEILTPTPEDSLRFYTKVLGLEESGRSGDSVYLRGWGEFFHHSVQLTEADRPGVPEKSRTSPRSWLRSQTVVIANTIRSGSSSVTVYSM